MRSAAFHPEAEEEFVAAASFYEQHAESLGREFIAEVRYAVGRIVAHPESGARFSRGLRRMLVDRFPYAVLFRTEDEQILLVAVMQSPSEAWLLAAQAVRCTLPNPRLEWAVWDNARLSRTWAGGRRSAAKR